jgi:hypothetical protein
MGWKTAPGEQLQIRLQRRKQKPLGYVDPGAEYMSKIDRVEAKTEVGWRRDFAPPGRDKSPIHTDYAFRPVPNERM